MKKSLIALIVGALVLLGGFVWLLSGADAKNLERQDVVVDVSDTFEK